VSNQDSTTPIAIPIDDCSTAMDYIRSELGRLRKTLKRTQIASVLIVVIAGGYLIGITEHFANSLEPVEAAGIASSLIDQKVEEQTDQMSDYAKRQVPQLISQAPDYVLKHVPDYRKDIEHRINDQFTTFAASTNDKFGLAVDKFLDTNKDAVAALLQNGNDPVATKTLVNKLNELFHEHLKMALVGGESIQQKLDGSLDSLAKVDQRMKRLATGKNLTPSEQSARRAIAVMLKTIDDKKAEKGDTGPLIVLPATKV